MMKFAASALVMLVLLSAQTTAAYAADTYVADTYSPDTYEPDTYTRLDFILEMFGRIVTGGEQYAYSEFPDVDDRYASVVAAAVRLGIANGHADGLFRPDDIVTVEQAVAMVIKFLGLRDHALTLPDELLSDHDYIPFWITPYLKWARVYSPQLAELFEIGAPASHDVVNALKVILHMHHQPVWLTPAQRPAAPEPPETDGAYTDAYDYAYDYAY